MKLNGINKVYLLGVGGIGMSALARYFKRMGKQVGGYDKTRTDLTILLEKEGVEVNYEDTVNQIPGVFAKVSDELLVIYTPAIPLISRQFKFFKSGSFSLFKRSEVLGEISKNQKVVAVAGTHGKTTVSTMIAHLLKSAGIKINAFLGGISSNYKTNFLFDEQAACMVVEADEYDHSFLKLYPNIVVVTSLEPDHLDIHGDFEHLKEDYQQFLNNVADKGQVFLHESLTMLNRPQLTEGSFYGTSDDAAFKARNIRIEEGQFVFDVVLNGAEIKDLSLSLPGIHNVENALVAMGVANHLGVGALALKQGLASFAGVRRRFERHKDCKQFVLIDDYAHHPSEIKATLKTVRALFPTKRITGIFQPHLFSRTRDLMSDFAQSFDLLDELVLLPIYPARELPIEGVTSEILLEKISLNKKKVCLKENVINELKEVNFNVLVVMGAGDIDQLIAPIKDQLCLKNVC